MKLHKYLFVLFLASTKIVAQNKPYTNKVYFDKNDTIRNNYVTYWDSSRKLTIRDITIFPDSAFILQPDIEKVTKPGVVTWLKFEIINYSKSSILIEVTKLNDQTTLYYPNEMGNYDSLVLSIHTPLLEKRFFYTNSVFKIPYSETPTTYYFKIKSNVAVGQGFFIRNIEDLFNDAIKNFGYFLFYIGIVFIILIYHLVFFIRIRQLAYLYYSLYLLSFGIYRCITIGVLTFLFSSVNFSFVYYTIPYALSTIFLLLYSDSILNAKKRFPIYNKLIYVAIAIRILIFIAGNVLSSTPWLNYQIVDFVLLTPALLAGIKSLKDRKKSSVFFIASFGVIFIGILIHAGSLYFDFFKIKDDGLLSANYLLFNASIVEIMLLSFALSEKYIELKNENEAEHKKTIAMQKFALDKAEEAKELKDRLNYKLEQMVAEKTVRLSEANRHLEAMAKEISDMNEILQIENEKLIHDVETLNNARILKTDVSFKEFKDIFPNEDKCLGFLADLKWKNGYACKKCGYKKFYGGTVPFSRKCKSCKYQESATANTVMEGVKFSLIKALYIVYRAFYKEKLNESMLAEEIQIRKNTVYTFSKKIDQVKNTPPSVSGKKIEDWTTLIFH